MDTSVFLIAITVAAVLVVVACALIVKRSNQRLYIDMKKFVIGCLPELRVKTESYYKIRDEVLRQGNTILGELLSDPTLADQRLEAISALSTSSRLFDGFDYKTLCHVGVPWITHSVLNEWDARLGEKFKAFQRNVDALKEERELILLASEINIE